MTPQTLITTYLEMKSADTFQPHFSPDPALYIMQAQVASVGFYRFLYEAVGARWAWRDRLIWQDEALLNWLKRPTTSLYVLYVAGTPAGYIELDFGESGTEIAYFGLIEGFMGRGYGKHLLSYGSAQAWHLGAERVWVHTCNLDSPHALPTYQACGFQIYDRVESPMPETYQ